MRSPAPRRSIRRHGAFHYAVAVWFALLFGLAILVMPRSTLADSFAAIGLDAGGFDTAPRVALALSAAVLGFLLGLGVGHLLRLRPHQVFGEDPAIETPLAEPAEDRARTFGPPRLFNPREDIDEDAIGFGPPPPTPRAECEGQATGRVDAHADGEAIALGDRSLPDLTTRLAAALAAYRSGGAIDANEDPVIAFLRREVEGAASRGGEVPATGRDTQAALRQALDRLSDATRED